MCPRLRLPLALIHGILQSIDLQCLLSGADSVARVMCVGGGGGLFGCCHAAQRMQHNFNIVMGGVSLSVCVCGCGCVKEIHKLSA